MRHVAFGSPATEWLAGPRTFREIGCCINRNRPDIHTRPLRLPDRHDAIIFFNHTTPTELLPYRPPTKF